MKRTIGILLLFWSNLILCQDMNIQEGEVTFVTSRNAYVRFQNTDNISIGDTLSILQNGMLEPCLLVDKKSTTSIVGTPIGNIKLSKGDKIAFRKYDSESSLDETIPDPEVSAISENEFPSNNTEIEEEEMTETYFQQKIQGKISASSYSNLSSETEDRHRALYRFSLTADHLSNSGLSLESYMIYRQDFRPASSSVNFDKNQFRLYNLALIYDVDSSATITLGRKINYKASSLGAIDGIQMEKYLGSFSVGAIAGFRPDIFDYGLNTDLLEYGGYVSHSLSGRGNYAQTTLGLMEQRNAGAMDRRYAYFQHSSTINRKINIFSSFELDLYNQFNANSSTPLRLTNLYTSLRYRLSKKVDFTVSYDSRKRIIYYETLKTDLERLLDDDEARQGLRFRVNIKPIKYIYAGASYSMRFQNNNQNKSDNINGYLSISRLPMIQGRFAFNYNLNKSSYLSSKIMSFRYSRDLIERTLSGDFYFRLVNYDYLSSEVNFGQKFYGANLSWRLNRKWSLSILGEMATREIEKNYRINTRILTRF